jgi:hypothetical protein
MIVGAVLSILTVTDIVAGRPAPFVAVQVVVTPAVSDVNATGSQPEVEVMRIRGR